VFVRLGLLVIIVRFRGNDYIIYLILGNFKIKLLIDNFYLV